MFRVLTNDKDSKTLRTKCEQVTVFDKALEHTVEEMIQTMITPDPKTKIRGIGIAGNQVGILKRIIILTFGYESRKKQKIVPMINPEILELSEKKVTMEEGCLSLPDVYAKVSRPAKVKVRWQNLQGHWCEKKLEKWDARIFLHEFDHLEGKLFIDYLKNT